MKFSGTPEIDLDTKDITNLLETTTNNYTISLVLKDTELRDTKYRRQLVEMVYTKL